MFAFHPSKTEGPQFAESLTKAQGMGLFSPEKSVRPEGHHSLAPVKATKASRAGSTKSQRKILLNQDFSRTKLDQKSPQKVYLRAHLPRFFAFI
jgi:hypothetical protein